MFHDEPSEIIDVSQDYNWIQDVIRVLHVDDEADQLIVTKRFLEDADPSIHVESASSPVEALRLLQEGAFDCVVSDYEMPGMDGVELARRVRETSGVPFVIYTGKGSEEVAARAFAAGVDDYLRKELDPSHYAVLTKRIRIMVEKHRAEEAGRERVKELSCLYGISHLVESGLDLEGILEGVVNLIPPAWHYPKETCARITFEGRSFETDNFIETSHKMSAGIRAWAEKVGARSARAGRLDMDPYRGGLQKGHRILRVCGRAHCNTK